jgi:hypothetical protein
MTLKDIVDWARNICAGTNVTRNGYFVIDVNFRDGVVEIRAESNIDIPAKRKHTLRAFSLTDLDAISFPEVFDNQIKEEIQKLEEYK